ncbi:monofunctional isopimaradiene synthase, chloroplastic-like [Iris pallida]|uniref:Monofunctional isopimaradiene synthase, chloroplastic-like n=1 Tax=Iris pallida TaxID=29817 RepID=A0AAX6GB98_IRIPA|nr:monofunctional isopimaradiene synthase, chloroplastic-like [Iris pallida]KAJ6825518.1 monofunctional isopimaradiene synthase, chloroplastic-like [Iris pallida]
MYNVNNPKYMELAKLEHNRLQIMYKREIHSTLVWSRNFGFDRYPSSNEVCPENIHILIAATMYEPELVESPTQNATA